MPFVSSHPSCVSLFSTMRRYLLLITVPRVSGQSSIHTSQRKGQIDMVVLQQCYHGAPGSCSIQPENQLENDQKNVRKMAPKMLDTL